MALSSAVPLLLSADPGRAAERAPFSCCSNCFHARCPPPPAPSRRSRSGVYYATLRQRIPAGFPGCAVASRLLIEKHLLSRVGRPAAHARSLQHGFFVPTVFLLHFLYGFGCSAVLFFCLATLGVFAQCAAVSQQRVMLLF